MNFWKTVIVLAIFIAVPTYTAQVDARPRVKSIEFTHATIEEFSNTSAKNAFGQLQE